MTRESGQSTEAGASENSAVSEAPPPTVRLQISAAKKLNLAAFQNAVPALYELVIVNETSSPISELTVQLISEPPFVKPRVWNVESVGAGESYHLRDLDVQLDGALLSRLTEAESASLHFELRSRKQSDEVLAKNDSTVELLARNQWGGIGHLPEMVAAFVQPNDQAIDRLLRVPLWRCRRVESPVRSTAIPMAQNGHGSWRLVFGLLCSSASSTTHCHPPVSNTQGRRFAVLHRYSMAAWPHALILRCCSLRAWSRHTSTPCWYSPVVTHLSVCGFVKRSSLPLWSMTSPR